MRSVLLAVTGALLVASLLVARGAEERSLDEPACKAALAAFVQATKAKVDHESPHGDNMFLLHPAAKDVLLRCASYQPSVALSFSFSGVRLSKSAYALVGDGAAAVFGDRADAIKAIAARCQSRALRSADGTLEVSTGKTLITCTVNPSSGGYTQINVGPANAN